ncbi:MAG: succinyldiaminopimelate transaminase [Porticoccaceae bacterium]
MNPRLSQLRPYPFARLRALLKDVEPNPALPPLKLSLGEPEHAPPAAALEALKAACFSAVGKYPSTTGTLELRIAIADWLKLRFRLKSVIPDRHILPANGTREALFSVVQALTGSVKTQGKRSCVLIPNPFYQIYEGAAILAGVEPVFYPIDPATNQPDFDAISADDLDRCELMYICTPGNPSGQSLPLEQLKKLIELAQKHDFVLVSDECYSELYLDESQPCIGLLQASEEMGNSEYKNCLVCHSLSKRSNLPGLRSGFVAGDADLIEKFLMYRTYHGSAMALHHQAASAAAWQDETHVANNRHLYRQKYNAMMPILEKHFNFIKPDSGFYLWLKTPIDDQEFTKSLYQDQNLVVVPGSFLARDTGAGSPGKNRIRLALVSSVEACTQAAERLCNHSESL